MNIRIDQAKDTRKPGNRAGSSYHLPEETAF